MSELLADWERQRSQIAALEREIEELKRARSEAIATLTELSEAISDGHDIDANRLSAAMLAHTLALCGWDRR